MGKPKTNILNIHRKSPVALAVSGILAQAVALHAQTARAQEEGVTLDVVEVTATRRSVSVQDVPLNVTAIGGDSIAEQRITNLVDVARTVPGLFVLDQGSREANQIVVRGLNADNVNATEFLGNTGGGTVATYVGEIPLYIDLALDDIERVEVLLGPQGTLYGAGTLGGAIRYIPRRPSFGGVELNLRAGAFALAESDGVGSQSGFTLNVPLSDTFALRGSLDYLDDPGFIDYDFLVRQSGVSDPQPDPADPNAMAANLRRQKDADTQQRWSGRVGLRWRPSERFDANLTYYQQNLEVGARTVNHRTAFDTGRYESGHRFLEPNDTDNQVAALELTADLGFAELTSATAASRYEDLGQRDQTDLLITLEYSYEAFPAFSAYTRDNQKDETFNQELRLVSQGEGRWNWIAGAFYNEFGSDVISREFTPGYAEFLGGPVRPDNLEFFFVQRTDRTEQAVYGEIGYEITDRWQVTVGGRWYDYDLASRTAVDVPLARTVFNGDPPDSIVLNFAGGAQSDGGMLFKFNTSFEFTDAVMGYLTVSEGYRMGNTNGVTPCPVPQLPNQFPCGLPDEIQYAPDRTINHEIGLRSQWLDRRLTLNGNVYYIDWQDPQLAGNTDYGGLEIKLNGQGAQSRGVEISFDAQLTQRLNVRGSLAYVEAQLSDRAPALLDTIVPPGFESTLVSIDGEAGDRLPGSPEQQGSLHLSYDVPLANAWRFSLDYGVAAASGVLTRTGSRANGEALGGFAVHSAAARLAGEDWSVQLYADNLLNKYAETGGRATSVYVQRVFDANGAPVDVRRYFKDVLRPREIGLRFTCDFDL